MKTISFITLSIILSLNLNAWSSKAKWEDFTQKQIFTFLDGTLNDTTVAVRVKGLVCESCGLGLRKKISKLEAVDTERFKKGIAMDVYKMLLTVAVKEGATLAPEELKKAIDAAGYEAVYYYQLKGGKVVSTNL